MVRITVLKLLVDIVLICGVTWAHYAEERTYHHYPKETSSKTVRNIHIEEFNADYWTNNAADAIKRRLERKTNTNIAKNVIMFLGDGMSIQTLAPARILLGQRQGKTGEEEALSFEKFPTIGLAKTYCVDYQIPDSACTATAYLSGVKNNYGTIGVTASVPSRDCNASQVPENQVDSIAAWALQSGKDAGIVTNTRITHASPAGAYANIASRYWESDSDIASDNQDPNICADIAKQLVHEFPGKDFKVVLGGGRRNMIPVGTLDEENTAGLRTDGRNLTNEWIIDKDERGVSNAYVWNREDLLNVDIANTDYLLGLFEGNHLRYNLQTDAITEPSLQELTEVAIKMLQKSDEGYFLFVEGGRIDHAHHETWAQLSLDETIEFAKAVEKALSMTNEEDTLIVVTSDHSHVMAFNGYSKRGNDILGPSHEIGDDGVPFMTLSYTNGPGFRPHASYGIRQNPAIEEYYDVEWRSPTEVFLDSETHGGEDIAVFALGPYHHLFTGLYEQNEIPHLMAYAACIGPGVTACNYSSSATISSISMLSLFFVLITTAVLAL